MGVVPNQMLIFVNRGKLMEQREKIEVIAQRNALRYKAVIKHLKTLQSSNADRLMQATHEEVFEQFDCLTCANCCKTTSPIFTDRDIDRISRKLRLKPGAFIETYLIMDSDNHFVLKSTPCFFLAADNTCVIYNDRPQACRTYPHTDRKRVQQISELTLKNTYVCPAVQLILENIERKIK
jgi:Fe-S-cluster containining protein